MTNSSKSTIHALGPVYICHGATGQQRHVLSVVPEPDSIWVDNGVSFYDILGDDALSIVVKPEAGEYQKFLSTGVPFELECPSNGANRELVLRLRSEYTAEAYPVELRLGDYHRKLTTRLMPPAFVSKGDEVKIQVNAESVFVPGKMLKDVEVEWWKEDVKLATIPTSVSGVSEFIFKAEILGDTRIVAKVYSPYDDSVFSLEHSFTVLSDEPWKGAEWFVNDKEVGPSVWLARGQINKVKLIVPELKGTEIKLDAENSEALKFKATPAFGEKILVSDDGIVEWTLTQSDAVSGRLRLAVESIQVPGILKATLLVMSEDPSDEVDATIDGEVVPAEGVDFFHGRSYTVGLKAKPGSPLDGQMIKLNYTVVEGVQAGDLTSQPDFNVEQVDHEWVVAAVKGEGKFRLELIISGMSAPLVFPVFRLRSGPWKNFSLLFDGVSMEPFEVLPATLWGLHTITLIPDGNAPDDRVKLDWGVLPPGLGLELSPPAGTFQTVDRTKGATWELRCLGLSGDFSLEAAFEKHPISPWEIPLSLFVSPYTLEIGPDVHGAYPKPPEVKVVYASGDDYRFRPLVRVRRLGAGYVPGVSVKFIVPTHPDETIVTDESGIAQRSSYMTLTPGRTYELITIIQPSSGRASMMRALINVQAKP